MVRWEWGAKLARQYHLYARHTWILNKPVPDSQCSYGQKERPFWKNGRRLLKVMKAKRKQARAHSDTIQWNFIYGLMKFGRRQNKWSFEWKPPCYSFSVFEGTVLSTWAHVNVLPFSLFWLAPDAVLANPHVRLVGRRNGVQMVSRVSFLDSDHWRAISRYLRGHMNSIGANWGELLYRMCFAMEKVRSKNIPLVRLETPGRPNKQK